MKGLWQHPDGRLKTGIVSAVVLIIALGAIAGLMQIKTPIKEAIVTVTHVMEPESAAVNKDEKPAPPEQEVAVPEPRQAEAETEKSPDPVAQQKMAETKPPEAADQPDPKAREEAAKAPADTPDPSKDVPEVAAVTPAPGPSGEAGAEKAADSKPDSSTPDAMAGANAPPMAEPEKADDSAPGADSMETASIEGMVADTVTPDPSEPDAGGGAEKTPSTNRPSVVSAQERASASVKKPMETTVDTKSYVELIRQWREAPGADEKTLLIGLQVEHLRDAYELFQMKAVAVVKGARFFDLEDGTRIADSFLDSFSSTCFKVSDPWTKWRSQLRKAGIGKAALQEVRYYMHPEIRNAIYHRAGQAVDWCRSRGRISAQTAPGDIDVRGRAYTIRRSGGGSFGVFIPHQVVTRDGSTIDIPVSCFQSAPDVKALMDAGAL